MTGWIGRRLRTAVKRDMADRLAETEAAQGDPPVSRDMFCRCGHRFGQHYPRGGSDLIQCDVCIGNEACEDFHPPSFHYTGVEPELPYVPPQLSAPPTRSGDVADGPAAGTNPPGPAAGNPDRPTSAILYDAAWLIDLTSPGNPLVAELRDRAACFAAICD